MENMFHPHAVVPLAVAVVVEEVHDGVEGHRPQIVVGVTPAVGDMMEVEIVTVVVLPPQTVVGHKGKRKIFVAWSL